MATLHKIDWGFNTARLSGLEGIEDQHTRFTGAGEPTGFLKLEDDFYLLQEDGTSKIILEATP